MNEFCYPIRDGGWRYARPGSPRFATAQAALEALGSVFERERDEARAEVMRLRAAGAVLLRAIYSGGLAYSDDEVEAALKVFATPDTSPDTIEA